MSQLNKDIHNKVLVNSWKVFEKWDSMSNERKLKNSKQEKTHRVISFSFSMIFLVISFISLLSLTDYLVKEDITLKISIIISFACIWIKAGVGFHINFYSNKNRNSRKYKNKEILSLNRKK